MNATDAMGEGDRKEGNPSPEDGAADGVRFVRNRADKDSRARFSLGRAFSCAWEGVAHNMQSALDLGNRILMMDSGDIVLDIHPICRAR